MSAEKRFLLAPPSDTSLSRREGEERSNSTWDLGWAVAIAGVSLVLRLVYVFQFTSHPLGRVAWVDEGAFCTRALAILDGHWLPERPFYQDSLFAYVLAGLMRVVGTDVGRLRVALACLGSLTPLAVYSAGRLGLGRAEAILAGLTTVVFGPLMFTDGLLEKEGVAALAAALALGLSALASKRPRSCMGCRWCGLRVGHRGLVACQCVAAWPARRRLAAVGVWSS